MTQDEILIQVQLPLAAPAIFSGLQIALASTMAIATIASTISAGGLGELMFAGLQTENVIPILWGDAFNRCFNTSMYCHFEIS